MEVRLRQTQSTPLSIRYVRSLSGGARSIPERRGTLGWTHIFNSNVVNQFNPGLSYTSNTVNPANAKTLSLFPMTLTSFGVFTDIGWLQYLGSGGSATTIWQLNDNLTWTAGKHSFQFGENLRRVLATVIDSSFVAPLVDACSLTEFTYGASCFTEQIFRTRGSEDRLANVNLDLYAMDTMRATSKLTVTVGLRVAWNSDPVSQSNQFSRLSGSFAAISHDVNQPPNQVVIPNQSKLWGSTPLLMWEPRTAIAYQFAPKTVLRAGFGVFTNPPDLYQLALNPPTADLVNAGFFSSLGPAGGIAIAPGVPGSVVDAAVAANQQFQQNFSTGGLSCASPMAPPNACILPFFFTARESGRHV